jgi:hypothetical protein
MPTVGMARTLVAIKRTLVAIKKPGYIADGGNLYLRAALRTARMVGFRITLGQDARCRGGLLSHHRPRDAGAVPHLGLTACRAAPMSRGRLTAWNSTISKHVR